MGELKRLVLDFRAGELVVRCLYRTNQDGPGPSTKARRREVAELTRPGPVLNMGGAKTLIAWDRLVLCELVED